MRRWLLLVAVVACGDSSGPDVLTREDVAGTYTLRTVNGQALPFVWPNDHRLVTASELALLVAANGSVLFRSTTELNGSLPSQIAQEIGWGPTTGDSLVVNVVFPLSLEPYPGSVHGDTITLRSVSDNVTLPEGLFVYVREGS